ncbi:hypothetical protein GIB67_034247 [Kingdonia uniflora]|uniref:Aminotransferase-like plant mobile domain-containing protein n=1 Tax=Kingdonia uniflora TaxID=39325 RepID=A0A7J7NRN2_9MAGN|nr:hypothetical protein GIB67_034247 [Kingdonia uniflora]
MLTGLKFGIGCKLLYDEGYSKLEEAEKIFPGITSTDIRYGNITLAYLKTWKEPLNPRLNNCDPQMDIAYARVFIAYMMGSLFFSNGSTSLRAGYLVALTYYDIICTSSFDWGMPIMATLYRGLDEVSVLKDGKMKKLISGFYAMLEFWFFEYCWVVMYLVKVQDYGVQATGDQHDMGWFMNMAGMSDQRRRIPISVMQVPYPCPPTYSIDELWHQSQGMRHAAYEDSRQLVDCKSELEGELGRVHEVIRETS